MSQKSGGTRVLGFMNAFSEGMSGGDIRFIEVMKRLDASEKSVVTSSLGRRACESRGLSARYLTTSRETAFRRPFLSYVTRTIAASDIWTDVKEVDVVYSSSDFVPDILPAYMIKGRRGRTRWVVLLHLVAPDPFRGYDGRAGAGRSWARSPVRDLLYKSGQLAMIRLIRARADLVLVVNPEIREYLVSKGIPPDRVLVVKNGIDLDVMRSAEPSDQSYDACYVGRLHAQKGIPDLLRIWREVCSRLDGQKLAIVGSGTEAFERRMKEDIDRMGLRESVDVLGHLGDQEKLGIMKASKVLLFPSYYESFGIVALEAMACGLPVVCYDLPPLRSLLPRGLTRVALGDTRAFAQETVGILSDDSRRGGLGEEGRKFAESCDWSAIARTESEIIWRRQ